MFHEDWYSHSQIKNVLVLVDMVKYLEGNIIENGCWE